MRVTILHEAGYEPALVGLSLSHSADLERMPAVAARLAHKGGGHNKFLESIILWLDVTAPRYWWAQADTYRLSTKQSGSTMHTLTRRPLTHEDFELPIMESMLGRLNYLITQRAFEPLKNELPEGYLQRRVWCMSYKTAQNIIAQRSTHRLAEWQSFIAALHFVEHPEFLFRVPVVRHAE